MQNSLSCASAGIINREAPFKARVADQVIAERSLEVERKTFFICIKENHQGRLCRITEEAGGRRNTIIIPASGLSQFAGLIAELALSCSTLAEPPVTSGTQRT